MDQSEENDYLPMKGVPGEVKDPVVLVCIYCILPSYAVGGCYMFMMAVYSSRCEVWLWCELWLY